MAWVKNKYTGKLRLKVGQLMLILERKGQSCLTWHAACTAVRLRCTECPSCPQARSVPEDCESADALKAVAEDMTAQTFIVMSVDLVTDVCLEVSSICF